MKLEDNLKNSWHEIGVALKSKDSWHQIIEQIKEYRAQN